MFLVTVRCLFLWLLAIGVGPRDLAAQALDTSQDRTFDGALRKILRREPLGPSSRKTSLVVSEIMYKAAPRPDGKVLEFVELYNSAPFREDISGYRLTGAIEFRFPSGMSVPGGGFLVVAKSPKEVAEVYALTNVLGPYAGSLRSSGPLRLLTVSGAVLLEVPYSDEAPWPKAADGAGHSLVLARPSYGESYPQAWSPSQFIGGSPGAVDEFRPTSLDSVVINEFLANGNELWREFIELFNYSNQPLDLSGCVLTDDPGVNRFTIPSGTTLPPRGFIHFTETQLSFGLNNDGEAIYLKEPAGRQVLDALAFAPQAEGVSSGRFPDGNDDWYSLQTPTPGQRNNRVRQSDVVINEIMYAPLSDDVNDEYVELYNRGVRPVDLSGWSFVAGIEHTFRSGTILGPNEYLVVARNAANLRARNAHLNETNTSGDFGGRLSNSGERLALARPAAPAGRNGAGQAGTGDAHVVMDEVAWGTGGRWGRWAHKGGSSLELADAVSNHRLASNWADSDESGKAPWTTIEATAVLERGANFNNGPILNLEVMLLGEGECLLDEVEVFAADGRNLVENSAFEEGLTGWVAQGNHIRSTLANEGYGSPRALHIRASSRGDTGANRIRAGLSTHPQPGDTVTIRVKARWLAGWPEILLRLHGNWMEATGRLDLPQSPGTPGRRNSRAVGNGGPALFETEHYPPVPSANQPVTVTVRADDADGIKMVRLNYRIDPDSTYTTLLMTDDGAGSDDIAQDGIFAAQIPAPGTNALAAFFIDGVDEFGAATAFPNDAPERECLVRYGDPQPVTRFGVYRQWFTQAAIEEWTRRPVLSNERLDGTFVYGNSRIIYNFGSRYAGSPFHQGFASPLSDGHYSIEFPRDDLLLGTENFNKVHAPGNGPFDDDTLQREQTCFWMARQLGLPSLHRRYVAMFVNGQRRGTLMEDTQTPGSDVIDQYFPGDRDGYLFKLQAWFEFDNRDERFLPFSHQSWCMLNRFIGSDGRHHRARYRWNYQGRAVQSSANEYSPLFDLIDAANAQGDPAQAAQMNSQADMDQWMRTFAVEHAVGNWDSFGANNEQNMYAYKPAFGRWTLFIWDYNIVLGNAGSWGPGENLFTVNIGDPHMQRLQSNPPFRRAYWAALKELCYGAMEASNVNPVLDEKFAVFRAEGLNVASPAAVQNWIAAARVNILQQMREVEPSAFVVKASSPIQASSSPVVFKGEAPFEVQTIRVNGAEYPVTWSSIKDWSMAVPLSAGSTALNFQGFDRKGRPLPNATASLTANLVLSAGPRLIDVRQSISNAGVRQWHFAWSTKAGQRFRLESKNAIGEAEWQPLDELIARGQTMSVALPVTANSHTFVRLVLLNPL